MPLQICDPASGFRTSEILRQISDLRRSDSGAFGRSPGRAASPWALSRPGIRATGRKTAGESQALDGIEKIAGMGLMGLGGLIAVIGGVLFLLVVFRAMWDRR